MWRRRSRQKKRNDEIFPKDYLTTGATLTREKDKILSKGRKGEEKRSKQSSYEAKVKKHLRSCVKRRSSEPTKERMLEGKGKRREETKRDNEKRGRRNEARVAATGAASVTVGAPAPAHSWRALPRCDLWKQRADGEGYTVQPASLAV